MPSFACNITETGQESVGTRLPYYDVYSIAGTIKRRIQDVAEDTRSRRNISGRSGQTIV